ncbi:MAG: SPOR domain-containing protein [Paludibacter sp.]|nr:SPOR domain-containing protein [Paludibacter sp.]
MWIIKCNFALMTGLYQHIENLLIKNDYVIVPNFGGFVVQQQSSKIEGNTIIPPLAVISFNPLLQHSDGLLEMEIARAEQISYRQAVEIISDNVFRIKNLLNFGEKVNFGQIGEIVQNEEILSFIPSNDSRFLPSNFGLQKVDFHSINNINRKGERPVILTLYPKTILRYAASIALIFIMLSVQPFLDGKPQQASLSNIFNIEKTNQEFNVEKCVVQNQNIIPEQSQPIVEKTDNIVKNYHLIAGCFQGQHAAEKYANLLKNKNLETEIEIFNSTNLQRVSIGSFATFEDAKFALKNLKNLDKYFENVWIMYKKM